MRMLVRESKERIEEKFSIKISARFMENKLKLFRKNVKKEMGGGISGMFRIKNGGGVLVKKSVEEM